jgi:hypothetical protein
MLKTTSSDREDFCVKAVTGWEPQGTKFRPCRITILIFSYVLRWFVRLLSTI